MPWREGGTQGLAMGVEREAIIGIEVAAVGGLVLAMIWYGLPDVCCKVCCAAKRLDAAGWCKIALDRWSV